MKIISHRGNIDGRVVYLENSAPYLQRVLNLGFDVECDIWYKDGYFYLGHDSPCYIIDYQWLCDRKDRLWIHCKNLECVRSILGKDLHFFWHENDCLTLTSMGIPWCREGIFIKGGVTVSSCYTKPPNGILGVCTDEPLKYLEND